VKNENYIVMFMPQLDVRYLSIDKLCC
jgi:hypothetical protein